MLCARRPPFRGRQALIVDGPSIDGETRLSTPKRLAEIFRQPQTVEKPKRGAKPFHTSIVPGGVYGGGGAIFASENPIFQSKNRFLTVSAPENPQDFSGNWRGRTKAAACGGNRP